MEDDELDKLATEAKLDQIGAGEKSDYLDELYGGGGKLSGGGYDKGAGLGASGASNQLSYAGQSNLDRVMNAFASATRGVTAPLRPVRPAGQVGQLGQLQMQMSSPGAPRQLGPQLCQPRPLMAMSSGRSSPTRRRAAKSKRRCSCTH